MLKSVAFALATLLTLSSCSTLAPLAKDVLLGSSQRGIEARANISKGDAEGQDSVAQNANTAVSVDAAKTQDFGSVETVINESGFNWWELGIICMLAGWAIPSPEEMAHGVVRIIRALRGSSP